MTKKDLFEYEIRNGQNKDDIEILNYLYEKCYDLIFSKYKLETILKFIGIMRIIININETIIPTIYSYHMTEDYNKKFYINLDLFLTKSDDTILKCVCKMLTFYDEFINHGKFDAPGTNFSHEFSCFIRYIISSSNPNYKYTEFKKYLLNEDLTYRQLQKDLVIIEREFSLNIDKIEYLCESKNCTMRQLIDQTRESKGYVVK